VAALALVLAAGCNNDCYNLAKNICACQPTATAIQTCNSNISTANSAANPTSADLARCTAALNACDCRILASGSAQSKVTCGLARANPTDTALNNVTVNQ
jgi:hypothetical protein